MPFDSNKYRPTTRPWEDAPERRRYRVGLGWFNPEPDNIKGPAPHRPALQVHVDLTRPLMRAWRWLRGTD